MEFANSAIVVDVGIGFRNLKNRAMTRNIDLRKIKAVLVSHEHSDHVYGLRTLCKHLNINAYMTAGTYNGLKVKYRPEKDKVKFINIGEPLNLGPFAITSFAKPHDVQEPCSFLISVAGVNIGVFTDIGAPCDGLTDNLAKCHLAFLESNYDEDLLRTGSYPLYLKRRITSGFGHLSNVQSAKIVEEIAPPNLHTIFLSHISENNNRPDIALQAFAHLTDKYLIKVMSRNEASDVWHVSQFSSTVVPHPIAIPKRLDRPQLDIFEYLNSLDAK